MEARIVHTGVIRLGSDADPGRTSTSSAGRVGHARVPGRRIGIGQNHDAGTSRRWRIANSYGVVIVDCKGGGLGDTARTLAERYDLPFYLVDPDDAGFPRLQPVRRRRRVCRQQARWRLLVRANAEIYKNIAMEAIPVIVRGLQATGEPVTLDTLYDSMCGARHGEDRHKDPRGQGRSHA